MPVCLFCESQEFELHDGLYYCRTCQVESQEVVEELRDDFDAAAFALQTKKVTNIVKETVDRGKPWYTAEAFQAILKAQIDALVALGCNPKLKEVTKQIWFKYIHKSGIAIIDPALPAIKSPSDACWSFRDRYLSGMFGRQCLKDSLFPVVSAKQMKQGAPKFQKSGNKRVCEFLSSSDDEVSDSSKPRKKQRKRSPKKKLKDNPWRGVDERFILPSDSDHSHISAGSTDEEQENTTLNSATNKKKRIDSTGKHNIQDLSLLRLISILHIALQWCQEVVTIGDLIQWIKQGYLPFIDCLKCLPPHMKLTVYDVQSIKQSRVPRVPSYQQIAHQSMILTKYLEIPTSIPDVDIRKLVARYVLHLNLPLSLIDFVESFMQTTEYEYKRKWFAQFIRNFYSPEAAALSLIIVACKLLLGIDDETEWEMENELIPCVNDENCIPFSWKKWANYHARRIQEDKISLSNCFQSCDADSVTDIHSYVEHFENVMIKSTSYGKDDFGSKDARRLKDKADAKAWPYVKLCGLQGSSNEIERRSLARQYPFTYKRPADDDYMGDHCIAVLLKYVKNHDFHYVWYGHSCLRVEKCMPVTPMSCRFNFYRDDWKQGDLEVHYSYDFLLSVACNVSLVDKIYLHATVQEVERRYLQSFLQPKDVQEYSSSDWSQLRFKERKIL